MEAADSKQYIIIYLGTDQYGIDIRHIDSIIVMQGITRVPKAQSWFKGVINLRGEVVPVMSLRSKLGMSQDEFTGKTRIVIVKPDPQAAPVGLIVDRVKEVVSLSQEDIEKMTYDEKDINANYSLGIGKYNDDLINLINIVSLVAEKEAVGK